MVWRVCRSNITHYNLKEDVMFQTINMLLNIHSDDYNPFDFYYLWRVGINMYNIDRTIHDEEFFNTIVDKVKIARYCNFMGHYRPIGIAVTLSAIDHVDVGEDICDKVDVVILKHVENKDTLIEFRRKNKKLTQKPILVWLSKYGLDDTKLIIKLSDGLLLDFYDNCKTLQELCSILVKQCRELHKPIIINRPGLLENFTNEVRRLLGVAESLVDLLCDGILLNGPIGKDAPTEPVYNVFCALQFIEIEILKRVDAKTLYLKMRSETEFKPPVTPPLSVAMAASLAAIYSGSRVIMISTHTGRSARWLSCAYPPGVVLAVTSQPDTARLLHIYRKIMPLYYDQPLKKNKDSEWRNREDFAKDFCVKIGLLRYASKYVVVLPGDGDGYCSNIEVKEVRF